MTLTNLPVQPPAPTTAAHAPVTAVAEQSQTTDFLLMLGQLVAASIPSTSGVAPPFKAALVSGAEKSLEQDEIDPEELLAMLSLAFPPQAVSIDVAGDAAMRSSPVLGAAGGALAGTTGSVLQGVARELTDAQLLAGVVDEMVSTGPEAREAVDSFQIPTAPVEQQQQTRMLQANEAMSRPVHVSVGSAAWADEIGSRLVVMTQSGNHTASLKLSPEHLGPLEISIVVRDDKASVWFGAAHADTRAAIETALPRLREMFESQGLSLTDAGVFREPPREQQVPKTGAGSFDGTSEESAIAVTSGARIGLLDAYA